MYKQILALDNLLWLICHKTKPKHSHSGPESNRKEEILHFPANSLELELHYQIQFNVIPKTPFFLVAGFFLCQGYCHRILSTADWVDKSSLPGLFGIGTTTSQGEGKL